VKSIKEWCALELRLSIFFSYFVEIFSRLTPSQAHGARLQAILGLPKINSNGGSVFILIRFLHLGPRDSDGIVVMEQQQNLADAQQARKGSVIAAVFLGLS
jgi:hypothetical protein